MLNCFHHTQVNGNDDTEAYIYLSYGTVAYHKLLNQVNFDSKAGTKLTWPIHTYIHRYPLICNSCIYHVTITTIQHFIFQASMNLTITSNILQYVYPSSRQYYDKENTSHPFLVYSCECRQRKKKMKKRNTLSILHLQTKRKSM